MPPSGYAPDSLQIDADNVDHVTLTFDLPDVHVQAFMTVCGEVCP